ncbi:MAG: dihydroxyacetone kinase subunit DhaL [Gemmataceae bacterium]
MAATLTHDGLVRMLREGAARLRDNHDLLSRLDAATGDGDHGATMRKVAATILETVQTPPAGMAPLLEAVGWAVMSVDGGSTSPLFGSLFLGMADAAGGLEQADASQLASLFESGTARLRAQTQAKPGDKTLVDALVPAVQALRDSAERGESVDRALAAAADAAAQGAEATRGMQARFGRARNLGARTVGQVDPGATSMTLLFAGFRDAVA